MKKEIYLPLLVLKKISEQYPKAWNQMEMFHSENGSPQLGSWPDWCYAPMSAALAVASKGYDLNKLPIDIRTGMTSVAQAIFAIAPWRLIKDVFSHSIHIGVKTIKAQAIREMSDKELAALLNELVAQQDNCPHTIDSWKQWLLEEIK